MLEGRKSQVFGELDGLGRFLKLPRVGLHRGAAARRLDALTSMLAFMCSSVVNLLFSQNLVSAAYDRVRGRGIYSCYGFEGEVHVHVDGIGFLELKSITRPIGRHHGVCVCACVRVGRAIDSCEKGHLYDRRDSVLKPGTVGLGNML